VGYFVVLNKIKHGITQTFLRWITLDYVDCYTILFKSLKMENDKIVLLTHESVYSICTQFGKKGRTKYVSSFQRLHDRFVLIAERLE